MTELIFFGVLALLICVLDWRKGVVVMVAVGFLADPVRKLLPGEPVAMTIAVAPLALVSLFAALEGRTLGPARRLMRQYPSVTRPLQVFLVWVALAAVMTIVNYKSPMLAGIGAVAYLAPFPGLLLAYYYASSSIRVDRFFKLYVSLCALMSAGIYISRAGFEWSVLRGVGQQMYVSTIGKAYSGFFRTPEVAAWHVGSALCLVVILVVASPKPLPKWLAVGLIAFLAVAGLMTGRRKMVAQVLLFAASYGLLLAYYRGAARRLVTFGLVLAVGGGIAATELIERSEIVAEGPKIERYLERGVTVFEDAPERLRQLGFGSVVWAIQRHGWVGQGAGVGSQGSQHFGGGVTLVGGAGEGGLGKIVLELGVPGLLICLWLLVALGLAIAATIDALRRMESELVNLACGLTAFLGAQIPAFVAAAQIFGDPFVLITLGSVLGFLLAIPSWARPGSPEPA